MRYLDEYSRITVSEFAQLADIADADASDRLVLLTRAGVLQLHAGHGADFYTIAYDLTS
jgi:hypothetical protein